MYRLLFVVAFQGMEDLLCRSNRSCMVETLKLSLVLSDLEKGFTMSPPWFFDPGMPVSRLVWLLDRGNLISISVELSRLLFGQELHANRDLAGPATRKAASLWHGNFRVLRSTRSRTYLSMACIFLSIESACPLHQLCSPRVSPTRCVSFMEWRNNRYS